ncbi:hypothetical protein BJF78_06425 [Pseudonocardia sp. CNS-139]|nr:hypothetical protein BJF78_06425 [Pseudonocardia sp. CNS-139]
MSSPGKARWCIAVRMSPGSNACTRSPGSSTASTAASWSSAAFAAPYPPQPAYASTAASELSVTIVPVADARSSGSASWVSASGARTVVSSTARRASSG